jgi:hypothetical protein
MPYAASIADLTAHKQNPVDNIPMMLLAQVIEKDPSSIIECERGKAAGMGHGALFLCDDERAQAIIKVIRAKYKKHEWRFYHKMPKGWKRI